MLKKRFLEGPCAPPFFSAVVVLLWATVATAQPVDRADLERCAAMSTDARKLACFESLLEEPGTEPVKSAAAETEPPNEEDALAAVSSAVASEEIAEPAASNASVAVSTSAANEEADIDVPMAGVVSPDVPSGSTVNSAQSLSAAAATSAVDSVTQMAAPAADEAAVSTNDLAAGSSAALPDSGDSAAAAAALSDDFGREHVANEEREADRRVTATVTEVTRDYTKRLVFHFENGQVWRQQEARRFQYPKNRSFDVEIARGVFGDYQLRVGGEGRMTRIKRLQ